MKKHILLIVSLFFFSKVELSQVIASFNCGTMWYQTNLTLDSTGKIFFAEPLNNRIRKLDVNTCTITNVAGTGGANYAGDGGLANSAQLNDCQGLIFDKQGNLLIADYLNHVIRKVNMTAGIITTIAGTGFGAGTPTGGYTGDGGLATSARFSLPNDVAIDKSGNIYVSEQNNGTIRKINLSTGIITTIVGTGVPGFSGDGGQAALAQINPRSLALDTAGNIYIGEESNWRIRKVNVSTGIINTIAGNGVYGYSGDGGLAINASFTAARGIIVDKNGFIYFADTYNNRIRKIDPLTGIITTIVGTGASGYSGDRGFAINAVIKQPEDISIDTLGNLFFADRGNNIMRVVYNCSKHKMTLNFTTVQDLIFTNTWNAYPNYPITADSAKWYWGDGTSSSGFYPTHTYSISGQYTICVTAYSICGDSVSFCLNDTINNIIKVSNNNNPNNPLLINEQESNDSKFKLYPNPSSGQFIIETEIQSDFTIDLFDITGRMLFSTVINQKKQIDLNSFNDGVYILSIRHANQSEKRKIILQR